MGHESVGNGELRGQNSKSLPNQISKSSLRLNTKKSTNNIPQQTMWQFIYLCTSRSLVKEVELGCFFVLLSTRMQNANCSTHRSLNPKHGI